MLPDLAGVITALTDGGVRFVVIGGVAVAAHGHLRTTADVDLVPDPDRDNLDALVNALVRLDARLTSDATTPISTEHRSPLYRGRNVSVTTRLGDLDIVQRPPGVPSYDQLAEAAQVAHLGGTELLVCSLDHLRAMKAARGSAQDLADLERLGESSG
jgi:predicted nucleotidyltransferase